MEMIKVGDTAEVVKIIDDSFFPELYKNGDSGIVTYDYGDGSYDAIIGKEPFGSLFIDEGCSKKIGRLKVRKVK